MPPTEDASGFRFAEFTFSAGSGELYRHHRRVALRPQAATVLELLVRRAGELVTREELQDLLWGDTAVDADAGINHCIRQVRRALADSAGVPRFVATEPRRGYRFIADVHPVPGASPAALRDPRSSTGIDPLTSAATTRVLLAVTLVVIVGMAAAVLLGPGAFGDAGGTSEPAGPADEPAPAAVFPEYQRARYLLQQPGVDRARRAVPLLERVVRQAPGFAPGHAALGRALFTSDPLASDGRARYHVEEALRLSPELPEALLLRGEIHSLIDRDWSAAERDFRRAEQAAPDLPDVLQHLAGLLSVTGRHQEGIRIMRQAVEIDPVSPLLAGDLAWFHFAARDWQAARMWAEVTLDLEPGAGTARSVLLHASARLGDTGEVRRQAAATLREAGAPAEVIERVGLAPDPLRPYWGWWESSLSGAQDPTSRVHRAWALTALGRSEAALDDLEAAEAAGLPFMPFLISDPRLEALHGKERFEALLDRLGLPPSGQPATAGRIAP